MPNKFQRLNKDGKHQGVEFLSKDRLYCTLTLPFQQVKAASKTNLSADGGGDSEPTEEGNILRQRFRILSDQPIINFSYFYWSVVCLEWPAAVLKKAVNLLSDAPACTDHHDYVSGIIGKNVEPAFNDQTDPPGLEATMLIDKRLDEKTFIKVQEGYVKCCSAGLASKMRRSHPDMTFDRFIDLQGEEVDGEIVRFIAEEILSIREVSVVIEGADPTAEAIESQNKKPNNMEEPMKGNTKLYERLSKLTGVNVVNEESLNEAMEVLSKMVETKETITSNPELERLKKFEDGVMAKMKEGIEASFKLISGNDTLSAVEKRAIEGASYQDLADMKKELDGKKIDQIPALCSKCNEPVVLRSSVDEQPPAKDGESLNKRDEIPSYRPIH